MKEVCCQTPALATVISPRGSRWARTRIAYVEREVLAAFSVLADCAARRCKRQGACPADGGWRAPVLYSPSPAPKPPAGRSTAWQCRSICPSLEGARGLHAGIVRARPRAEAGNRFSTGFAFRSPCWHPAIGLESMDGKTDATDRRGDCQRRDARYRRQRHRPRAMARV